mmetsp:Transcript_107453/g.195452  ORF Transcript_107453/g.195452 Transcript_107453/m.195452 type:complete len:104 (+) Transcript_107453:3-314(+)
MSKGGRVGIFTCTKSAREQWMVEAFKHTNGVTNYAIKPYDTSKNSFDHSLRLVAQEIKEGGVMKIDYEDLRGLKSSRVKPSVYNKRFIWYPYAAGGSDYHELR